MEEARASWNTVYQSKEGFECQITLRDDDEVKTAERAKNVMVSLIKAGAAPIKRWKYTTNNKFNHEEASGNSAPNSSGKTYIDEEGTRRCNRKLKNGVVCGYPVTERQGKYGPFWSCPNFKEHTS
jgi:hypothetical protein